MDSPEQLNQNGIALFQQGKRKAALAAFESAVAHPAAHAEPALVAELYNNIGVVHKFERRFTEAHRAFERASLLFQQQQMQREFGMTLGNIGDLLVQQKRRDEAATTYAAAADVLQDAGASAEQSRVLRALSLLRLRQLHCWDAIDKMEASLNAKPHRGAGDWLFLLLLRFALQLFRGR